MELSNNQVVKLRNGKFGVVASFNNMPFQLIFAAYTNPIKRYNENLEYKNHEYDIVEVFDGSKVTNVADVFKNSFKADGLESVWKKD